MARGSIPLFRYDLERIEVRVIDIPCAVHPDLDSYCGGSVGRVWVRVNRICQPSCDILQCIITRQTPAHWNGIRVGSAIDLQLPRFSWTHSAVQR